MKKGVSQGNRNHQVQRNTQNLVMSPKTLAKFINWQERKINESLDKSNLEMKNKCCGYIKDLNCDPEKIINTNSLKSFS